MPNVEEAIEALNVAKYQGQYKDSMNGNPKINEIIDKLEELKTKA